MKAPGAILLIACYELGHQPLAVAWPAAFLERRGYAPAMVDISVEPLDPDQVRRARLVAVSVPMHTALRLGVTVARRVRDINPDCHICFYGLYATLNANELLSSVADSVLAGELEEELVRLVQGLEHAAVGELGAGDRGGEGSFDHDLGSPSYSRAVPNLHRHPLPILGGNGSIGPLPTPVPRPQLATIPVLAKLDFPVPSRRALPQLKRYAHLEREGKMELAGYVEASRGCKHLCRHCPIPPVYGGRFFVVPAEVVQSDMRQLVEAGARHITFGDPDFLNGPRHALAVAEALHAEFPQVTFDFTAKVEHLLRQRALLPTLAGLGGLFVVSAVESLSDTVLANLDKGHSRADVVAALHGVREAGMTMRPTWVPFTPWTTLDDYREMLEFIEREDLVDHVDPVQYSIRLLVPPGSLLLESPAMHPHLGPLVEGAFHYRWTHPDARMDHLQEQVARMVAAAADAREDAAVTAARVRTLTDSAAGLPARVPSPSPAPERRRPPRLTEAWFC